MFKSCLYILFTDKFGMLIHLQISSQFQFLFIYYLKIFKFFYDALKCSDILIVCFLVWYEITGLIAIQMIIAPMHCGLESPKMLNN